MKGGRGAVLFDWGGTLMRVFPEYSGAMKDWPRVEAVPGAAEALAALQPDWTLALATNADVSSEADIRAALARAGLDRYLDRIYCFRNIGFKKPCPDFYRHILDDLALAPENVFMVGDDHEADVLGASRCGIRAVWFNPQYEQDRTAPRIRTIHRLEELPGLLAGWERTQGEA